jgi:hypothetical protein
VAHHADDATLDGLQASIAALHDEINSTWFAVERGDEAA